MLVWKCPDWIWIRTFGRFDIHTCFSLSLISPFNFACLTPYCLLNAQLTLKANCSSYLYISLKRDMVYWTLTQHLKHYKSFHLRNTFLVKNTCQWIRKQYVYIKLIKTESKNITTVGQLIFVHVKRSWKIKDTMRRLCNCRVFIRGSEGANWCL